MPSISWENEDMPALFQPGRIVFTPGVWALFEQDHHLALAACLSRHLTGDWGEAINQDDHDREVNNRAAT
jgi:hypothetical protein